MENKHTPGPWVVVHSSQGYSVGAQHAPDCFPKTRLCDLVTGTKADARLIAAAPELLAALESAELSCTQARLANGIGKKTKQRQIYFLLSQFEQLAKECRTAINKARHD